MIERGRKIFAQQEAWKARRRGELIRQPCEVCGSSAGVLAHHDDYDKPLEVRWLCHSHHIDAHGGSLNPRKVKLPIAPPEAVPHQPITGEELRHALGQLGMTQMAFANKMGVTHSAVYRWLSGQLPVPVYVEAYLQLASELLDVRATLCAERLLEKKI